MSKVMGIYVKFTETTHQTWSSHKNKKKKKRKKNEYVDSDCYSKRKELQRLGKLLSVKPNDINIKHSYFQTNKLYKNMIN